MPQQMGRYTAGTPVTVAEGWQVERITSVSRLFGANGIRTGADGRIYVAQVSGSQISAVNPDTGEVEAISAKGGEIVAPDDIVFDEAGNLYATEITEGRVSVLQPNGTARVILGDMPCANPITMHQGRLLAGECRVGGRIMELDLDGGAPRVVLDNVPMPNAMEVGPDGMLYMPIMGTNEIWRVSLDGGAPEVVATELGVPDSVKFDRYGQIVSTQVASGQVLKVDPATGAKTVLADVAPGLDNVTFVGDRIFVSSISGQINEVLPDGKLKSVVPDGFNWPLGLTVMDDGVIFAADGPFCYYIKPGEAPQVAGMLFSPGSPGYTRGVVASGPGELIVTTANGQVSRWRPAAMESEVLSTGYEQLYGVALAPGGTIVFADQGTGKVHALSGENAEEIGDGLDKPSGVAVDADGTVFVAESGAGRVVKLSGGKASTVIDGLKAPQGILVRGGLLYIVDADAKELIEADTTTGTRRTIASGLPVGAPSGVIPKFLGPIGDMSGPMGPFAGITAGPDGMLYVSGDAEGSVLAVRPI